MPTLNLNDSTAFPTQRRSSAIRVWTRARWADAWTLRPDMQATQMVWSAFPEISTAALHYRYGYVMLPGANTPTILTPITVRGYWVLIAIDTDDTDPAVWLGYAENPVTNETAAATLTTPATGTQVVPCFGMERIWDHCYVESTVHAGPEDSETWVRSGNIPAVFNRDSKGNRTANQDVLNESRPWQAYAFARPDDDDAETWSSQDILQHLIGYHAPTSDRTLDPTPDPSTEIPWAVSGLTTAAAWDAPTLDTDGRSVGDLLRSLITPAGMMSLTFGATASVPGRDAFGVTTGTPVVTSVVMHFATRLITPVTIPNIGTLPYDSGGVNLFCADDPLTSVSHRLDDSDVVDQIVVQGPPEISVCTLEHALTQWVNDWETGDATEYDAGGEDVDGWDDMTNSQRREANEQARSASAYASVYRDLRLSSDFDGKVRESKSMFPDVTTGGNATGEDVHVPYAGTLKLLDDLPLYDGVDYTAATVDETRGYTRRPILYSFETPTGSSTKRVPPDLIGDPTQFFRKQHRQFQFSVTPRNDRGPVLQLNVEGAPRFVIIAGKEGNDGDGVGLDAYDHTTLETTVAFQGDRRPQWLQPYTLPSLDVIRRRVYTFNHRSLELVYLVPDTVVGYDDTGDRQTAPGGVIRNPLPRLRALAEMIGQYQHAARYRVEITTRRVLGFLPVGANLRNVDTVGADVAAPIVEVRIDAPVSDDTSEASEITQTITAASHRFDVLSAIQRGLA